MFGVCEARAPSLEGSGELARVRVAGTGLSVTPSLGGGVRSSSPAS